MIGINEILSSLAGGSNGRGIAEYLFKVTALLLLAWGLSFVLRRASASARHLMWMGALFAVFALPFLSGALPAWRVALPAEIVAPRTLEIRPIDRGAQAEFAPAADVGLVEFAVPPPVRTGAREDKRPNRLVLVWALGAALLGLRLLASALSAWRLARRSTPIADESVVAEVVSLCKKLGIRSGITVVESARVGIPMAWGMLRKTIFLPTAASGWSEERRRVVLLHELAHLKRRDCETLMLARIVAAFHWFNPLVWVAVRRLQAEREHACDDLVLTAGTAGTDYAHHLLDIARGGRSLLVPGWAMTAMARPSELEGRLLAILDPSLDRGRGRRASHLVGVLVIALLALPLAALQPKPRAEPAQSEETLAPEDIVAESRSTSSNETQLTQVERQAVATRTVAAPEEAPTNARSQKDARLVEVFAGALRDTELETRAVWALGMIGSDAALDTLLNAMTDESEAVRQRALWAVGRIAAS